MSSLALKGYTTSLEIMLYELMVAKQIKICRELFSSDNWSMDSKISFHLVFYLFLNATTFLLQVLNPYKVLV